MYSTRTLSSHYFIICESLFFLFTTVFACLYDSLHYFMETTQFLSISYPNQTILAQSLLPPWFAFLDFQLQTSKIFSVKMAKTFAPHRKLLWLCIFGHFLPVLMSGLSCQQDYFTCSVAISKFVSKKSLKNDNQKHHSSYAYFDYFSTQLLIPSYSKPYPYQN